MVGPLEGGVGDRAGDEGGEDGGGGAAPGPAPQGHGDGGAEVDVPAEHGRQSQCLGRSPLGQAESKALWKRKSLLETFESEFVTYASKLTRISLCQKPRILYKRLQKRTKLRKDEPRNTGDMFQASHSDEICPFQRAIPPRPGNKLRTNFRGNALVHVCGGQLRLTLFL